MSSRNRDGFRECDRVLKQSAGKIKGKGLRFEMMLLLGFKSPDADADKLGGRRWPATCPALSGTSSVIADTRGPPAVPVGEHFSRVTPSCSPQKPGIDDLIVRLHISSMSPSQDELTSVELPRDRPHSQGISQHGQPATLGPLAALHCEPLPEWSSRCR